MGDGGGGGGGGGGHENIAVGMALLGQEDEWDGRDEKENQVD